MQTLLYEMSLMLFNVDACDATSCLMMMEWMMKVCCCVAVLCDHQMGAAVNLKSIWKSQTHFSSSPQLSKSNLAKFSITHLHLMFLMFNIHWKSLWYFIRELFIAVAVIQLLHLNHFPWAPSALSVLL